MPNRTVLIFCAVVLFQLPAGASERWRMQYFYDEDRSSLTINDLQFPSARRGVAVGYLSQNERIKPASLVTSDGGAHWSVVPLKETGISLFFLNESLGWMAGEKNLWQTEEAGRSWRKLRAPPGLVRVYFTSPQHGWAVGARKSIYETNDGGKEWIKVPAAAAPKSNPEYTAYTWIEFANKEAGMIAGSSRPPRRGDSSLPDWIDPENAVRRREWPAVSLILDTRDGGKTWTPSTASIFGRLSRIRLLPDGRGLALIEFLEAFEWPAEVHRLHWKTGKSERVYRQKDRAVTDVMLPRAGPAYLAAIETTGQLRSTPIPGKLKMIKSNDLSNWREMEVDYRAAARRAMLAMADPDNIWVATDTGMILKLELH